MGFVYALVFNYNNSINKVEKVNLNNEPNYLNDLDDVVGYLKIDDILNVKIVQTTDNKFYLNHDEKKLKNKLGSVFVDYRVNSLSKKILIYGHNSKDLNVPFKTLDDYIYKDFYEKHKLVNLNYKNVDRLYEIFSVFIETNDFSYMNINMNEEQWKNHLIDLKSKSIYKINVNVNNDDQILILQTCSEFEQYDNYDKKYLLIIARRIK